MKIFRVILAGAAIVSFTFATDNTATLLKSTTKNKKDYRFLKSSKSAKASSTSVSISNSSSQKPIQATKSPSKPSRSRRTKKQIFYSDSDTSLQVSISTGYSPSAADTSTHNMFIDLGVVTESKTLEETLALVQASLTLKIEQTFRTNSADVEMSNNLSSNVYLQLLAYPDCTSASACQAANITPTPLVPEQVPMLGLFRDYRITNGVETQGIALWEYLVTTNSANFILAGKGTGEFFLQAKISIDNSSESRTEGDSVSIDVLVRDWLIVVEDGGNMSATESNGVISPP